MEALRTPAFDVWLWEPNEVSRAPRGVPVPRPSPLSSPFSPVFNSILQILVKLARGALETERGTGCQAEGGR